MLCYVRWVYITYGIAFNTKQNLDIKKQPVEIGLKAQVLRRSWHENDAKWKENWARKLLWPEVKHKVRTEGWVNKELKDTRSCILILISSFETRRERERQKLPAVP